MSEFYKKACRWVNDQAGLHADEIQDRKKGEFQDFLDSKKELRKAEDELRQVELISEKDSKEYKKKKKEFEKSEKSFKEAERKFKRDDFKRTMQFVDMDFTYEEVLIFSVFIAILTFLTGLTVLGVTFVLYDLSIIEVMLYGVPTLIILPALVMIFAANYPEILENRMKASTIGKVPETVHYMTMSMRVRPSLYRAVTFAAENTEDPISSGLNEMIWDVYLDKKSSLEESFLDFAVRWGEWNENLKRSLYVIRASMLEKTDEAYRNTLERANDMVIEGTKKEVEDFTTSLRTPTMILFAIGILLPLVIGAMLPMVSLAGLNVGGLTAAESSTDSRSIGLPSVILLMNVLCPTGALLYSYRIVGKRPGTSTPPKIESTGDRKFHMVVSLSILAAIALLISVFYTSLSPYQPIPYLFLVVAPLSYYCLASTLPKIEERRRIVEMERQFPDSLFQLGSRIAEGTSVERALAKTADTLQGSKTGELFGDIVSGMRIKRLPMQDALFGEEGLLKDFPSQTITTTMKTVVQITKKDPEEAGKTIIKIARYQQELRDMDHEVKNKLSKSVEMMKATSLVFAPIVMGIVASLYFMLERVFTGLGTIELISPIAFATVLGVYLILMGAVITYFTQSIESNLDFIEFKYSLGMTMLVSISVYSGALLVGRKLIIGM